MKKWFLWALILAGLAAGILLLWLEDDSSTEPAITSSAEERSQLDPENQRLTAGPGQQLTAAQNSARGPDSAAAQANSPDRPDESVSRQPEKTRVTRTTSDFPDEEESEEFVIGGLVQDEAGNPLSHIEVLAEWNGDSDVAAPADDQAAENVLSNLTGSDGYFLFSELEDGEYRVRLAPVVGVAPARVTVRAGTLNVNLEVVMLRDIRVYGTVKSTDGKPIEDVHIIAGPMTRHTRAGPRGEYELDISRQGNNVVYNILFQHKEFRQQRILIESADLDDLIGDYQLNVSMEPLKELTTVNGRLTDTEGNALGGKTLHIVTSQVQIAHSAQSDSRGNFLFGEVEPGKDYELLIRPGSGYKNKDINPLVVPDGGLTLDIELEPNEQGGFSGWMIDLDGNQVPGFSLTLHSTVATGQSVSVVGDQQGFFSVEDFPVGEAMFRTNSYPVLTVRGIRVIPEPKESITVILDTGRYVLLGWVINEFGAPVAASSVTLDWEFRDAGLLNSSNRKTTTDQDGHFVFTDLGPGLHTMQVSATGFNPAALTIDVGTDPDELVVELDDWAK